MKCSIYVVAGGLFGLLSPQSPAFALEQAVGGDFQTEVTWSALSTMIKSTKSYAQMVNARVDQILLCNAKGMLYTPGAEGVDRDGCSGGGHAVVVHPVASTAACSTVRTLSLGVHDTCFLTTSAQSSGKSAGDIQCYLNVSEKGEWTLGASTTGQCMSCAAVCMDMGATFSGPRAWKWR